MKVLIVASWYPTTSKPEDGVFFQQRARALARNGCQVDVIVAEVCMKLHKRKAGITVSHNEGVTEYRYLRRNITPFWSEGVAIQQIDMIDKLYRMVCLESGKPDVIHLESARSAYAAIALAKKEKIPLTYTEHYTGILDSKPRSFLDRTMKKAVKNADHIFLLCSAMKRCLNPPEKKSSFLPNAIDFSEFSVSRPSECFTFAALAGLRKIKGFDFLLRAFANVVKAYPQCRLIMENKNLYDYERFTTCKGGFLTDSLENMIFDKEYLNHYLKLFL